MGKPTVRRISLKGLVYALGGKEQPYDVYRFGRGKYRVERPGHNPFADSDITPPTVPGGISVAASGPTQVDLSWTASTDDASGVAFYTIYRDSVELDTTTLLVYSDLTAEADTSYVYQVTATDGVGNESDPTDAGDGGVTTPAS